MPAPDWVTVVDAGLLLQVAQDPGGRFGREAVADEDAQTIGAAGPRRCRPRMPQPPSTPSDTSLRRVVGTLRGRQALVSVGDRLLRLPC